MGMSEFPEGFGGSTGLADDYIGTMKDVVFKAIPEVGDGAFPLMVCDMHTDDDEVGNNGVLQAQRFGIGKKAWEAVDGGARVEGGPKGGFNNQTHLQKVLQRLMDLDEGKVRERWQETKATPQEAKFWEGLTCRWKAEHFSSTIGGERAEWDWLLPSEFIGWGAGSGSKAGSKAKADAKASESGDGDSEVSKAVVKQVKALVKACEDRDEFLMRAYDEIDGIEDDPAIEAYVDSAWS